MENDGSFPSNPNYIQLNDNSNIFTLPSESQVNGWPLPAARRLIDCRLNTVGVAGSGGFDSVNHRFLPQYNVPPPLFPLPHVPTFNHPGIFSPSQPSYPDPMFNYDGSLNPSQLLTYTIPAFDHPGSSNLSQNPSYAAPTFNYGGNFKSQPSSYAVPSFNRPGSSNPFHQPSSTDPTVNYNASLNPLKRVTPSYVGPTFNYDVGLNALFHSSPLVATPTSGTSIPAVARDSLPSPPASRELPRPAIRAKHQIRQTKVQRFDELSHDKLIASFTATQVTCAKCKKIIKLDSRDDAEYYPQAWRKHKIRCTEEKGMTTKRRGKKR